MLNLGEELSQSRGLFKHSLVAVTSDHLQAEELLYQAADNQNSPLWWLARTPREPVMMTLGAMYAADKLAG